MTESANGANPSEKRLPPYAPAVLAAVIVLAHAAWLFADWGPAYAGADAPGYFVQARLISTQWTTVLEPESPVRLIGAHWVDGGSGIFTTRYPTGYPLLIAVLDRLGGSGLALIINPMLASIGVALFFLLAARWTGPWLALAGTAVFASLAPFAEQSLLGFSHAATTTGVIAALWALERWREQPRPGNALIAGLLIGALPTVRYVQALTVAVFALHTIMFARSRNQRRTMWMLALAAAVPIAAQLARNATVFGSPFATAYALTGESGGFGLFHLRTHLVGYVATLVRNAGPVFLAGAAGMLLLVSRAASRDRGLLLLGLTVPVTILYMAFFWPFTDIRFLLPTLPLYVLGALMLVERLPARFVPPAAAVLLVLHAGMFVVDTLPRKERIARFVDRNVIVRQEAIRLLPDGAVVIAPLGAAVLLEYEMRWKIVDWSLLTDEPAGPMEAGVPQPVGPAGERQPSPVQPDKAAELRAAYAGLEPGERYAAVLDDVAAWADGAPIYWMGDRAWIDDVTARSGRTIRAEPVGTIEADARITEGEVRWWMPPLPMTVFRVVFAPD